MHRFLKLLLFSLLVSPLWAQDAQEMESIGFSRDVSPLVNIKKEGQTFYYHLDGQIWLDEIEEHADDLFVGIQNGYYGVLRQDGQLIVPFAYDHIKLETIYNSQLPLGQRHVSKTIILRQAGKVGVANEKGEIVVPLQFQQAKAINKKAVAIAEDDRWGWASLQDGAIQHTTQYTFVREFMSDDYVEIRNGNQAGLARTTGEVIIPAEYEHYMRYLRTMRHTFFYGEKDKKSYLLDSLGNILLSGHDHYESAQQEDLIIFKENNLYGLVDPLSKKIIVPPTYTNMKPFVRGLSVVSQAGKSGIIDAQGSLRIATSFDEIKICAADGTPKTSSIPFIMNVPETPSVPEQASIKKAYKDQIEQSAYIIEASSGNTKTIFSEDGQTIVPAGKYQALYPHYYRGKTYFLAYIGHKMGILDPTGKEILPLNYQRDQSYQFSQRALEQELDLHSRFISFASDSKDNTYDTPIGIFDLEQQRILVPPAKQDITLLNTGHLKIRRKLENYQTAISLYDLASDKTTNFTEGVTDIHPLGDGCLLVEADNLYRLTDMEGHTIYENAQWTTSGSFRNIRFPQISDRPHGSFYHGLKKVYGMEGNLFIDREGKEIRFDPFDQVDDFYEGFALVAQKEKRSKDERNVYKYGIIDRQGQVVLPLEFDQVSGIGSGSTLLQLKKGDYIGLYKRDGTALLEPIYEQIDYSETRPYMIVSKDAKSGLVDPSGKLVLPTRFERIYTNSQGAEKTWPVLVKEGDWYYFINNTGKRYPIKAKQMNY